MSGRRKSERSAPKANYAEVGQVLDDEDDDIDKQETKPSRPTRQEKRKAKEDLKTQRKKMKREADDDPSWNSTKVKGKKKKATKVYKDAGRLSTFLQMPMDILSMVFSCVEPIDLLQLSRSSKQLRTYLLSDEAISIWKSSHDNMTLWKETASGRGANGRSFNSHSDSEEDEPSHWQAIPMPAKPEHLNYADYARLLFEKVCFTCGTDKAITFENFTFEIRLCRSCAKTRIFRYYKAERALKAKVGKGNVKEDAFDVALSYSDHPYYAAGGASNRYYSNYDMDNLYIMHDLYKGKKQRLKEAEFTAWETECKAEVAAKKQAGKVVQDWLADYQRYGRDDVRQANARKRQLQSRRRESIRQMVVQEDFFNATLWREFADSAQGQRLFKKDTEFDSAIEWNAMLPVIKLDIERRVAYRDSFRDYDAKEPTRDWIYQQYLKSLPAPQNLSTYHLSKGDVLSLNAVVPFLEKPSIVFEYAQGDTGYNAQYTAYMKKREEAEQEWKEKWDAQLGEIKEESEQVRLQILIDIAEKVAAAFPDRQRKPAECIEAVLTVKGEDVKATDYLKALSDDLQGLHAVLGCGGCDQNRNRYGFRLETLLQHTHFNTVHQARSYNHRNQPNYVGYMGDAKDIPCPWRLELVCVPADILFSTNLLISACEKRIAREAGMNEEDSENNGSENAMLQMPKTVSEFGKKWRFKCEHRQCYEMRYGGYYGSKKTWDQMLMHVQSHFMAAQNLKDTLIGVAAVKIVEVDKPFQPKQLAVPVSVPTIPVAVEMSSSINSDDEEL